MNLDEVNQYAVSMTRRMAILDLEAAIRIEGRDIGPESCPVRHHFAPGCYAREMFLPKGLVVVGKIHKHAHVNVISQGSVSVFTEQEGVLTLTAPITFVSSPGTKRVVLVHEDCVWTTSHVTELTDLAEIERELIQTEFPEVEL